MSRMPKRNRLCINSRAPPFILPDYLSQLDSATQAAGRMRFPGEREFAAAATPCAIALRPKSDCGYNSHMSGSFARATPHTPHRLPPDYTSRRVKLRLFITLASVMLVAGIVERTLTGTKRQAPAPSEHFNNRLPTDLRTSHDPAGTFVSANDQLPSTKVDESVDPINRAYHQGWKDIFTRLDDDHRELLFELFYATDHSRPLTPEKVAAVADLLPRIARLWDEYQAAALHSLSELAEADRPKWIGVLEQADSQFDQAIMPIRTIADKRELNEPDRTALAGLRSTLVSIVRSQIQDDTPILRPAERESWFYEFSR